MTHPSAPLLSQLPSYGSFDLPPPYAHLGPPPAYAPPQQQMEQRVQKAAGSSLKAPYYRPVLGSERSTFICNSNPLCVAIDVFNGWSLLQRLH